jgi:hypothetical protein
MYAFFAWELLGDFQARLAFLQFIRRLITRFATTHHITYNPGSFNFEK